MERERYEHELLEYVEGRLDPSRVAAVRELLRHDPKMRARVAGMQRDREQLMGEAMEEQAPSGSVERAISQAERDALVAARPARRAGHSWKVQVGAMAALLALATLASLWAWGYANRSVQHDIGAVELPFEDTGLSPIDGWEDPDEVHLGTELTSTIENMVDEAGRGGLLSELEFAKPIAEAAAAAEESKPEMVSLDDLAVFDFTPAFVGPEYVEAIEEKELARAVDLAGRGRLVLAVELASAWEGEGAAWESLAGAGDWDAALVERVEPWGSDAGGTDLADESLPGEASVVEEPGIDAGERSVYEQDGRERFIITIDDATIDEIAGAIKALAERAMEMGGVVRVGDRGRGAEENAETGDLDEREGSGRAFEVLILWSAG